MSTEHVQLALTGLKGNLLDKFKKGAKYYWERDELGLVMTKKAHQECRAGYRYNIGLSQLDSNDKILSWVIHLSAKSWATRALLHSFLIAALEAKEVANGEVCGDKGGVIV